jgi:hypothetical protein
MMNVREGMIPTILGAAVTTTGVALTASKKVTLPLRGESLVSVSHTLFLAPSTLSITETVIECNWMRLMQKKRRAPRWHFPLFH